MLMKAFVASLAGLAVASAAHAATITYTLSLNDNGQRSLSPGSFAVYASVNSVDNAGIAAFTYGLGGITFYTNPDPDTNPIPPSNPITTAPKTTYRNASGSVRRDAGFTLDVAGDGAQQQTGSQDTTGTATFINVTYNVGQAAGTVTPYTGTSIYDSGTASYGASVLMATGTFLPGQTPTIGAGSATTGGNVFDLAKNKKTFSAAGAYQTANLLPEPASLAVIGVFAVGAIARRRHNA